MAIILDWSHALMRNAHASRDMVLDHPPYIAHLMFNMVLSEVEKFGASKQNPVVVAVDTKPYWRSAFYDEHSKKFPEYEGKTYKGNRVKDSAFDWETIKAYGSRCLYALDQWTDIKVIRIIGAEADDIIAVASEHYVELGQKVVNVTSDKDMRQTQRAGKVDIYDPVKRIIIPELNVERFKKLHIMQGDKGDNILAIKPRLGEKTAEKLYPELDVLLATHPDVRERYQFNEKLIDFNFIPEDLKSKIVESLETPHENFNGMKLMNAFHKLELNQLMDKIGKFKLPETSKQTTFMTQTNYAPNFDEIFGDK